jgi:beta-glucanase (GH16 family)
MWNIHLRQGAAAAWLPAITVASAVSLVCLIDGPTRAQAPTTVFADEFSAPALDRAKWNVIVTGRTVNNEQQAYVDSPETIDIVTGADAAGADGGALRIRARYRPGFKTPEGRSFDFTSGRIDGSGKSEFTYGTAAARIKLTAGAGLWPAFWALGAGRWPDTGEFDIMENVGDPTWTNVAMHGPGYSGNTPLVKRQSFSAAPDITGWHIYSVDWSADALDFKVDGTSFYKVTKDMVEKYGRWAYDNPKFIIVNLALGGQYPAAVNKIQTPYIGLAESTVDIIKADKAVMLVDWVRVTR